MLGLTLIAAGSGGASRVYRFHPGGWFGAANRSHLARAFSGFCFAINLGVFAVPGLLMPVATATFRAGHKQFVHPPPARSRFVTALMARSARRVLARLTVLYLFAYWLMTAAEVMISIACLEFFYTRAPRFLKSLIMALFMMSIAVGNLFTSIVNYVIYTGGAGTTLDGAGYFLVFTGLTGCAAFLFRWAAGWISSGAVEQRQPAASNRD